MATLKKRQFRTLRPEYKSITKVEAVKITFLYSENTKLSYPIYIFLLHMHFKKSKERKKHLVFIVHASIFFPLFFVRNIPAQKIQESVLRLIELKSTCKNVGTFEEKKGFTQKTNLCQSCTKQFNFKRFSNFFITFGSFLMFLKKNKLIPDIKIQGRIQLRA